MKEKEERYLKRTKRVKGGIVMFSDIETIRNASEIFREALSLNSVLRSEVSRTRNRDILIVYVVTIVSAD